MKLNTSDVCFPHLTSTAVHLHKDLQRMTGSQTISQCCCSSVSNGVHSETAVGIMGKAGLQNHNVHTWIHYMDTCTVHGPGPYSSNQPQLPQSLHHLVDCEGPSQGHSSFRSNLTLVQSVIGDAHKHTHKHYDRQVLPWQDNLIR